MVAQNETPETLQGVDAWKTTFKTRLCRTGTAIRAWFLARWNRFIKWVRLVQQRVVSWWFKLPLVTWFDKKFPGWELGVAAAIFMATCALIINIVFLGVATSRETWGSNGLGTLLEDDCNKVDWGNKIAHGFINVISTLLITQSNYCMQLLASPTRYDIDQAHRKRQWVDIGMPSFRNVWKRHVSIWRMLCWMLIAISSAPLHLLWNSVVIFSPSAYRYHQLTVTEGFVRGLHFDDSELLVLRDSDEGDTAHWPDNLHFLQQDVHKYTNLSVQDCKRNYAQLFIRDRADVVVVVEPKELETVNCTIHGSAAGGWGPWPYKWLCPAELNHNFECYARLFQFEEEWYFPNFKNPKVKYCLSQPMQQRCKLEYGFWITILTVIANFLKLAGFVWTWRLLKNLANTTGEETDIDKSKHTLLITTGDAIASFLETPDKTTIGISIVEKTDFENGIWDLRWVRIEPMPWRERTTCAWFRAIGLRWWLIDTILLSLIPLMPGIFLLAKLNWLRNDLQVNPTAIRLLGLGNPSGLFLFGGIYATEPASLPVDYQPSNRDILRNVALANIPQLVMTIAYYIWNSHLTVMLAAQEYGRYAAPARGASNIDAPQTKRGLRVTYPVAGTEQRATHFLTVPLKYWVWTTVFQTVLHWLASQAVFFARVDVLDHWLEVTKFSISQVGYSVLGMICFFAISTVVFLFTLWISIRRLDNQMPLAATCSGALSAACHPRDHGLKHHEKKVYWGVETSDSTSASTEESEENEETIASCTFTSLDASCPVADRFYA